MSAVDAKGRICSPTIIDALGWTSLTRLCAEELRGAIAVRAEPLGTMRPINRGQLRLPVAVRRACGIQTGDRVLLSADTDNALLVVYSPTLFETVIHRLTTEILDNDAHKPA